MERCTGARGANDGMRMSDGRGMDGDFGADGRLACRRVSASGKSGFVRCVNKSKICARSAVERRSVYQRVSETALVH